MCLFLSSNHSRKGSSIDLKVGDQGCKWRLSFEKIITVPEFNISSNPVNRSSWLHGRIPRRWTRLELWIEVSQVPQEVSSQSAVSQWNILNEAIFRFWWNQGGTLFFLPQPSGATGNSPSKPTPPLLSSAKNLKWREEGKIAGRTQSTCSGALTRHTQNSVAKAETSSRWKRSYAS